MQFIYPTTGSNVTGNGNSSGGGVVGPGGQGVDGFSQPTTPPNPAEVSTVPNYTPPTQMVVAAAPTIDTTTHVRQAVTDQASRALPSVAKQGDSLPATTTLVLPDGTTTTVYRQPQ